ncbi:MAG: ABC transporter ATP-binding protein, partial [Akkermansiaceae bacterium]|nr:ABC transporter ATP-binding protein [Akkermansiaceae bacterium]
DDDDDDDDELEAAPEGDNQASSRYEASLTRLQGRITWAAHLVLAVALPAALWFGYRAVVAETMDPGDLFVVMIYALMIIGPMVRLTRQGARSGKILANADRVRELVQSAAEPSADPVIRPLQDALVLDEVRINSRVGGVKSRRLGPLSLRIRAGEKVAVTGGPGTGKSTLLSLLAGWERYKGSTTWDGVELCDAPTDELTAQIAYVAQVPHWPAVEADDIASAYRDAPPGDPVASLLDSGRFRALRSRLRKGAGATIFSENVSHAERKVLALVRYRTSGHSLKLIDDPVSEMKSKKVADLLLSAFMAAQGKDQTLVVALNRPAALENFDRLIVFQKKGRIAFDGSPAEWLRRRKAPFEDGDEPSSPPNP